MNKLLLALSLLIFLCCLSSVAEAQTNQTVTNGGQTSIVNFPTGSCSYKWVNNTPGIGLAASGTGDISSFTAVNTGNTPIIATIAATPVATAFAYVANYGSNDVSVINTVDKTVITTIPVGAGPFGVSTSTSGALVYVTNEKDNNVSVISTASNAVIATISVGSKPGGVVVSPDGKRVYVANNGSNSVSVIDATTNNVLTTIPVDAGPFGIAESPDGSLVYVTNVTASTMSVISTSSNSVINTVPVNSFPRGIAVSPDGSLIYIAMGVRNILILNAADYSIVRRVQMVGIPFTIAISPDGTKAYVSGGDYFTTIFLSDYTTSTFAARAGYGISVTPDGASVFSLDYGVMGVDVLPYYTYSEITVGNNPISLGNFIARGPACNNLPVTFTITVDPLPTITAGTVTGTISTCAGLASASPNIQQFTVSGNSLTGNITAAAPSGFEISLSAASGYGNTLTIPQFRGKASNTIVYVRSAAAATGSLSGNVVLSSAGAISQNVAVNATVNPSLVINAITNQTVSNGAFTTTINFTGSVTAAYNWVNDQPGIGLAANGTGDIAAFKAINTSGSNVTATITVTPVPAVYAYVANSGANTVSVINTSTNKVITTIDVGQQPEGVCLSPDGSRAYVTNTASNTVSVINTATNTVLSSIPVGSNPSGLYGISVSPDGNSVYVASGVYGTIYVINTATNAVVSTISVGSLPVSVCVSPDGSKVYVANHVSNTISVIDAATNSVLTTIPVGIGPEGISVSPDGSKLYVANMQQNTISVISTISNTVIATVLAGYAPYGITESRDGKWVYFTNNSNFGNGTVSVIDAATNAVVSVIPVGVQPEAVSVSPDGSQLFVTNSGSNTVSVVDVVTKAVVATVSVGPFPVSFGNSFITPGTGCSGAPITFKITVNSGTSVIAASPITGSISACAGSASFSPDIIQFTVSGSSLSAGITASAPPGFEISLSSASGYGNNLIIPQSGGSVNGTIINVRSSSSATVGKIAGNVVLTSPGVTSLNVGVVGEVNALPTVNLVGGQTVANGAPTSPVNFTGVGNNIYNWTNNSPGIGLPATGTGNITSFIAKNTSGSPITATITVTPVSAAFAYIPNLGSGNVSVINLADNSMVTTIPVSNYPIAIATGPNGSTVYVVSQAPNLINVINTATNSVIGTIPLSSNCYSLCVSPDGNLLYASIDALSIVLVINTSTYAVVSTIGVGTSPLGVAVSPDGSMLYVANAIDNTVSVINTAASAIVATVNVGTGPWDIKVSPDGKFVYVSTYQSNVVSVISTATNTLLTNIPVGQQPFPLAVSPDGSRVYTGSLFLNAISVINTVSNTVIANIAVPHSPTDISVSPDGKRIYVTSGASNSVSVIDAVTNAVLTTIPVGTTPASLGNFIVGGTGCSGTPMTFTITVNSAAVPVITSTGPLSDLTTTYGTASPSTSFSISGTDMTAGILVSPPPGFEVSTDNVNFSSTVTLGSAGTISSTAVYVRLKSTDPVGSYSGDIVLSSTNAAKINVATATSTVNPAPLTITVNNVTKTYGTALNSGAGSTAFTSTGLKNNETIGSITVTYGSGAAANATAITYTGSVTGSAATGGTLIAANYTITYLPGDIIVNPAQLIITANNQTITFGDPIPVLTVTYNSFVNGENVAQLTTPPVITTTATSSSAPGTYTIDVNGATSQNYTITQVAGILTIKQINQAIVIPNTFTPNGDGINDVWNIKYLSDYAECIVSIFTRYGSLIYQSHGYPKPWDGTYKGSALPTGTYYYIINLQNGNEPLSGPVTIIR